MANRPKYGGPGDLPALSVSWSADELWRMLYGVVELPAGTAGGVEVGDFVREADTGVVTANNVMPANEQTDAGTEALNQEAFHDHFVGLALNSAAQNETVFIATRGRFIVACQTGTAYEVGKLVGIDEQGSGTALERHEVVGVATENLAVGRVAALATSAAVELEIELESRFMSGGSQAMA